MTRAAVTLSVAALAAVAAGLVLRERALDAAACWSCARIRTDTTDRAECVDCAGPCRVCGVPS